MRAYITVMNVDLTLDGKTQELVKANCIKVQYHQHFTSFKAEGECLDQIVSIFVKAEISFSVNFSSIL
jgi:hypothetical protein